MTTEKHDIGLPSWEIALTVEIVSAYVANNALQSSEMLSLIASVHQALSGLGKPVAEPAEDHTVTAAAIRKSITPDYLVSFIDGRRYKTLKRHLGKNGHTPESYRQKYGLGHDYPMVAEAYRAARSEIAKGIGLGRTRNRVLRAA